MISIFLILQALLNQPKNKIDSIFLKRERNTKLYYSYTRSTSRAAQTWIQNFNAVPPTAASIIAERWDEAVKTQLKLFSFTHKSGGDPDVEMCGESQISKQSTWIQNKDHSFLWLKRNNEKIQYSSSERKKRLRITISRLNSAVNGSICTLHTQCSPSILIIKEREREREWVGEREEHGFLSFKQRKSVIVFKAKGIGNKWVLFLRTHRKPETRFDPDPTWHVPKFNGCHTWQKRL